MKKIPALLLAASLALTMAACGGEAAPAGNDTAEGGAPGIEAEAAAEYPVTLDNGKTITINGAADAAISALGEHIDFMEAPSCVHDGNICILGNHCHLSTHSSPPAISGCADSTQW